MFLDKYKYGANIKESVNVRVDGKISQEIHDISFINFADIRCVSELSKQAFKNTSIEAQIANPFLLVKSFDKEISYLITWGYKDLEAITKSSDQKVLEEFATKQKNQILSDIRAL